MSAPTTARTVPVSTIAAASLTTLFSLILLYILLIILVLVFAGQVLGDLSFTRSSAGVAVVIIAIVFPLLLLSFIIINLVRLIRQRAAGRPGARFKSRLLLFFAVIVLLASLIARRKLTPLRWTMASSRP